MRINLLHILIYFFFINFFNTSLAKERNNIILKVENEIITSFEVRNKILSSLILTNSTINQENVNKQKKISLDSLILHKLRKIELSKYNFKKDNVQINRYLKSISSDNIEDLKKKFIDNNIDFELFLEEIEVQLKWQKFIFQKYSNKIEINEENINQEIEKFVKNKINIEEFNLAEIEILLNDSNDKKRIEFIKNQINNEGFDVTALKYSSSTTSSNKGDLGWVSSKSLSKEIYNTISLLKVGGVSKPIELQNRILFLKLINKRVSKVENVDLNKLRKNLIDKKKNELFNLYSRSHLSIIKNKSLIEYK